MKNIYDVVEEIGRNIGAAMMRGIHQTTHVATMPKRVARAYTKPARTKPECAVTGCMRNAVAKGACQTHYLKAKRLGMNLDKLSASDKRTLAQDGRKTRWQDAAHTAAKITRTAKSAPKPQAAAKTARSTKSKAKARKPAKQAKEDKPAAGAQSVEAPPAPQPVTLAPPMF